MLFPKPKVKFQNEWNSSKEVGLLGKHELFDGMKTISEVASLSKTYTNHCIRASVVTTLSEKGFSSSEIQTVKGQKRLETTIEKYRYSKRISSSKKMKLSHALSSGFDGSSTEIACCSTTSCVTDTLEVTENDTKSNENGKEKTPTLVI